MQPVGTEQGRSQQIEKGGHLCQQVNLIRIHVCDACTMPKIVCKTLMNRHHIPSTSIPNTIYLIYV